MHFKNMVCQTEILLVTEWDDNDNDLLLGIGKRSVCTFYGTSCGSQDCQE